MDKKILLEYKKYINEKKKKELELSKLYYNRKLNKEEKIINNIVLNDDITRIEKKLIILGKELSN